MSEDTTRQTTSSEAGSNAADNKGGEVLVERTPANLSAEQIRKGSPDAVQSIEEDATKNATESERERIAGLTKAFAGTDDEFLQKCIESGATVEDAKAERYDTVVAALGKANEEIADLKKKQSNGGKPDFLASDEDGDTDGDDSVDASEAAAMRIWNSSEDIREEFNGKKSTFLADYRRNPDDYK